ncbi:MAG: PD40 domain-containing protein, partial [Phycisphaerales bacterium]
HKSGYLEMQRVIREEEPTKPSTKLSTLGETLTDVAKHRGSTPDVLRKTIRGDLDWIVMKTLEKARDRRYDTVSALAIDVQRHLKDQPILARAPGTIYLLRKFLRRHRARAAAVAVTAPLLGTTVAMFALWHRDRIRFAEAESSRHRSILIEANTFLENNDLKGAIRSLETIVDSEHIGIEASTLHDQILRDIREQVRFYTERIKNGPEDANNYLKRAQYCHCLGDRELFLADMERYLSALYPPAGTYSNYHRLHDFLANIWVSIPTNLGPNINTSFSEWSPCISRTDGLSLLFISNRTGEFPDREMWIAERASISDPWNMATHLGPPVDGPTLDNHPAISTDGLSLYFAWRQSSWDLCVSTRETTNDEWGAPIGLGPTVNGTASETRPSISFDGRELFFTSGRSGGFGDADIYVATRESTDHPWGEPVNLGRIVNSPSTDGYPNISADGRLLFFSSFRPEGSGAGDILVTARATKTDSWGPPVNLGPTVNSPYNEASCCISADGSTLYFCSRRPGGRGNIDLWQVSIAFLPEAGETGHIDSIKVMEKGNDRKEVMP